MLLGIIAGILTTRLLGPSGKGMYAMFIANNELFVLFLGLSINTAIVYFVSDKKMLPEKVLGISGYIVLFSLIITGLINPTLYFSKTGTLLFPKGTSLVFFNLLILSVFFSLVNIVMTGFFQAYRLFSIINKIAIVNSIVNLAVYSILFLLNMKNIISITVGHIVSAYVILLFFNTLMSIFFYLKNLKIKLSFKLSYQNEIKPFFRYMITGHLSQLINFLNYRLDLWIMNYYLGKVEIGYYAVASGFVGLIMLFTNPIINVLTPYLVKYKEQEREMYFILFSRLNNTLVFFSALGLFAIGVLLIPVLYGQAFYSAIFLARILLPGVIFTSATKIFASYNIALNKLNYNLIATVFGLLISVVLGILLIPLYGAVGAAITSTLTYFVIFIVVYFLQLKNKLLTFKNYYLTTMNDFIRMKNIFYNG
jgi:O-antigen/teichoic acid export membrane protein